MSTMSLPEFCLVLLIGASGSGKSTFARKHFKLTEIVSSDWARGLVADDETSQEATADAFELVHALIEIRMRRRLLTVVDATNVRAEDRAKLVAIAKRWDALCAAIVIDPGEDICLERNAQRPDRQFGAHVVRNQRAALHRGLGGLKREGFREIRQLMSQEAIEGASIVRQKLWTDKREETGPFDIIGDIHGCADELEELLGKLGYGLAWVDRDGERHCQITPPQGRKAVFVGDIVDRGPRVADSLRLVMDMVADGHAFCVMGNHEAKVEKWLAGREVKMTHGLQASVDDLDAAGEAFKARVKAFLSKLISHYLLDGGKLAVAHAGIREEMQGRASARVREFCLYGETTGETDEFGLPVRHAWAANYRGKTKVVYGHTPVLTPEWLNGTLCIDTGCVFGGALTALRYPELDIVSVPARRIYSEPIRPLGVPAKAISAQQENDASLDLADVMGKRIIETRLWNTVTIREGHAAAALEVMARFAIDPRWLIYLPPTMSPSETSSEVGYLEHPREALGYFRKLGVPQVVCEEKHMGSRAVIVVARDEEVARKRFGVSSGPPGAVYTRTGRAFFADRADLAAVLARTTQALEGAGLFERLTTDWLCLDAEIMPWSAKAQALISQHFAHVGASSRAGLSAAEQALAKAALRGVDIGERAESVAAQLSHSESYAAAVRQYCWPISGLSGLKIAPFHLLASEGAVHYDKPHAWHMEVLAALERHDPLFQATRTKTVDLADEASIEAAIRWWLDMTEQGGEGMVVKPADFIARGPKGLIQPAVKCRGRDYLRLIYGPDYDAPANLSRLRQRNLHDKRSLAIREFALGLEALERFVAHAPLRRVHECVFGVLAMESEPVDPRL
ncbi:MAG: polynucleotide kinase-phosphatase [Alphaproteobacteria bacterium]